MNSIINQNANSQLSQTDKPHTTATTSRTDEESSYGVVLSTRPITSISQRIGHDSTKDSSREVIQEVPWTLTSMLERFSFKATYPWSTTDLSHTKLASLNVPQDLIVNSITSTPFSVFNYWRGDVEVRLQVTGTPFHQGMLAAVFVPLSQQQQSDDIIDNFSSMTVNPTCYLFPNANSNAVMSIPFNHPSQYLDLTQPLDSLGRLYIVVFNKLQLAAGASDTVTVSLFSRFLGSEFKVPRISGSTVFATPQSRDLVKSKISNVSSGLISKFVDKVLPHNVVTDTLLPMLTTLLDKPTDPSQTATVATLTNRMNFRSGVEHIDKLVTEPTQLFESNNMTFATNNDEMSLAYLKTRYSYLGTFKVNTSNTIGTVVASIPLNPNPNSIALNALNQVPLITYLSAPYTMWRGSLTFKIQIVATSLQTLKLFAAFNFNTFTVPTSLSLNVATSQYGEAFEINQGTNEIEFTVPFVSTTPYKYVPTGNTYSALDTLGYLNIVILNRLVAPSNTPTEISANVYIAGGDDFELSTLSLNNNFIPAVAQSSDITPPMESTMANVDQATEKLVAPPSTRVTREPVTQVMMDSVQDYLKKYQPISPWPPVSVNSKYQTYVFRLETLFEYYPTSALTFAAIANRPTTPRIAQGLFSHYSPLFRQFKGGLRFKISDVAISTGMVPINTMSVYFAPPELTPQSEANTSVAFRSNIPLPQGNGPFADGDYPSFLSNCVRLPLHIYGGATNRVAEFEVPFSSIYQSHIIGSLLSPAAQIGPRTMGSIIVLRCAASSDLAELAVHAAFNDEARFGTLYQVPRIVPQIRNVNGAFAPLAGEDYTLSPPTTNTLTIL
nr:MAG: polyprotein 2 [Picornavirales sp.]